MLDVKHRFHGYGSLKYVYKNGRAVRSRIFVVKYISNPRRKHSRFSIVVSKKVLKSAVGRNRIRRRVYEIVRQELSHYTTNCDVAIMVTSSEVREMPSSELQQILLESLHQTDLYKNSPSPATIEGK